MVTNLKHWDRQTQTARLTDRHSGGDGMKIEQRCVANSISYEFNKLMRQLKLAAVHLLGLSITARIIAGDSARRDKTSDKFLITSTFPPLTAKKDCSYRKDFKPTCSNQTLIPASTWTI